MKHITLILLLFLSFSTGVSQNLSTSEGNIKAGARIGFVGSQISGDDLGGYHKLGAYAGLFARIPLTKTQKWHFQMELNFIMKGSTSQIRVLEDGTLPNYYVLTLLYTETPFLFQYNIGFFKTVKGGIYNFDFELGPTLNFLFYQNERNQDGDIFRPANQLFNIFDIGIISGLRCTLSNRWSASMRWGSSIYPVRIPTMVYYRVIKKQFNTHLAFSVCYHFN